MFTIDPKLTANDLKGKTLYRVLLSMNNHQVATPETSLEEARSYVFFFREGKIRLSAYIGLHLLLTDRKLIYKHTANPFLEKELPEVEDEARNFAEYLGAMMDEVDVASMSDLEQDSWIEEQGIFSTKAQPEAVPMEQPPVPEAAPAAPAPQPPAAAEQPAAATEAISAPVPPVAPVKPQADVSPAAAERPVEAPVMEKILPDVRTQDPSPAAAKRDRETAQKETTTGIETPPKKTTKKISYSATTVVSRDREALARLFTSF